MRSWNIFKSSSSTTTKASSSTDTAATTSQDTAQHGSSDQFPGGQQQESGGDNNNNNNSDETNATSYRPFSVGESATSTFMSFRYGGGTSPNTRNMGGSSSSNLSSSIGSGSGGGMDAAVAKNDRMERIVSAAARNLGDGVQNIVMAAKSRDNQQQQHSNVEWKKQLTELLGGGTTATSTSTSSTNGRPNNKNNNKKDIDILLENSKCENFVMRCVENDLPPNLIHCLRLLRVLELQHAGEAAAAAAAATAAASEESNAKAGEGGGEANSSTGEGTAKNKSTDDVVLEPVSIKATNKVSRLLTLLCKEPAVGEQLRPHLFGLLALSGASYPKSGIHVARAASAVIMKLAEHCLTRQLVWFIYDRKMIVHMTDDIKDLCQISTTTSASTGRGSASRPFSRKNSGSNPSSSRTGGSQSGSSSTPVPPPPSVPMGLVGRDAEEAGLWVIALQTVVHLVSCSCRYGSVELVRDFEGAGGYDVLRYAIHNTSRPNARPLMELLPLLATCPTHEKQQHHVSTASSSDSDGIDEMDDDHVEFDPVSPAFKANALEGSSNHHSNASAATSSSPSGSSSKLATNRRVFEIFEELLAISNPLLREHRRRYPSKHKHIGHRPPDPSSMLEELASLSIHTAADGWKRRGKRSINEETDTAEGGEEGKNNEDDADYGELRFDVASELLSITLQLFSDHPKNYEILEDRQHVLTYYLLAFPCYDGNVDLKNFILKTLEFVLTGVGGGVDDNNSEVTPLNACVAIFFSLCRTQLIGKVEDVGSISDDATENAGDTPGGEDDDAEILELLAADVDLMGSTLEKLLQFDQRVAPLMVESGILSTNLDSLLDLISDVSMDKRSSAPYDEVPPESTTLDKTFMIVSRVVKLLVSHQPVNFTIAKDLDALEASTTEFNDSDVQKDPTNLHAMLRRAIQDLGNEASRSAASVFEAYMSSFSSIAGLNNDMAFVLSILDELAALARKHGAVPPTANVVERQSILLSMVRSVLEARSLARDSFRNCGGLRTLVQSLLALEGTVEDVTPASAKSADDQIDSSGKGDLMNSLHDPIVSTLGRAVMHLIQTVVSLLEAIIGMKSKNPIASSEIAPLLLTVDLVVDPVSSQLSTRSPASLNRNYMRLRGFYVDLATVIACTGVLESNQAKAIVNVALAHMDPALKLSAKPANVQTIRNPDAMRLVLGIAMYMPKTEAGSTLSAQVLDAMLRLCDQDRMATTLPQLASCGICYSLANPKEFGPVLLRDGGASEGQQHQQHTEALREKFFCLLHRLASCNMSYMDFVTILRCLAGPIVAGPEGTDANPKLPVISSSIRRVSSGGGAVGRGSNHFSDLEKEFVQRLEALRRIAESGDRIQRLRLGGDSINTIGVLMHQVRLEDRLRAASDEGRLKFVEIESIDSTAASSDPSGGSSSAPNTSSSTTANAANERVWPPLLGSGFTYSLWLRHDVPIGSSTAGSFYVLDLSSSHGQGSTFLTVWYDLHNQRFNVLSSASYRAEPICFPVSPLMPHIWHHILVTYNPSKRSMMSRKSVISIFVDGRALEAEVRVDFVNLPPNSRMIIGAPNPTLASSGIVRGLLPLWELGPALMLSTVLLELDAAAIYCYGPDFPGLLWGDRPQRLSLAATATATFSMLAETGEFGSVAGALRRRDIASLESAGHSPPGYPTTDELSSLNLMCNIPAECVVFGFLAGTTRNRVRNESLRGGGGKRTSVDRLVNLARLGFGTEAVATDAFVYGRGSIVAPISFADSLQWARGPAILLPLVNSASSPETLALALATVRESVRCHRPNLEMMQVGGCYRILGALIQEKSDVDERCLDQCLAFAIHGFGENDAAKDPNSPKASTVSVSTNPPESVTWVFSDLDAMKYLLLNHQVWSPRRHKPDLLIRLLASLNRLVDHKSVHKAFNARRLHTVGIVRWALHLMIEAAELYTAGEMAARSRKGDSASGDLPPNLWYCETPLVADVSVGGDPGNPFLLEGKNLLRRVLTFMLTPADLEALAESIIFTAIISGTGSSKVAGSGREKRSSSGPSEESFGNDQRMLPGSTMRLHLVRLLEELIVDGVNEIVASASVAAGDDTAREKLMKGHAGGVASPDQPYFSTSGKRGKLKDGRIHPKHQQAQAFLTAFAGFLTPSWFAAVLEGCREEASASATLRLMILMMQGSATFDEAFRVAGSFSPFVLSVPKYSTCPTIAIAILSQLFSVPILHIHTLPTLDPDQLCEVFDQEDDSSIVHHLESDPSSGIFALLAECLGRNIQIISVGHDLTEKAANTNQAIFKVLAHRQSMSPAFQEYCCTPAFLEPLSHALCLLHDEKLQLGRSPRTKRRPVLADVPKDLTPTERFVGVLTDPDSTGMGIVRLMRSVIKRAVTSFPRAAEMIRAIFRSFPIHASPEQVEVFHLVLIEQCRSVIEEVLPFGDAVTFANCIGVCSVLLDRLVGSFFTSEAALETTRTVVAILKAHTEVESETMEELTASDYALLTVDVTHIANLTCVTALRMSLPLGANDRGDEDLQFEVLQLIDSNIASLLLIPSRERKTKKKLPAGKYSKSASLKLSPLWQSTSIARSPAQYSSYPDLGETDNPEVTYIAPLLVSLHRLLLSSREDVRSLAISVLVALLQHRPQIMSELLVTEVQHDDYRTETIDVVNRGGFRALLAAQEAALVSSASVSRKYAPFFNWFEKHQFQVQLVFDSIDATAMQLYPALERTAMPQTEAVENEQKLMLMRLTSESGDRSILGGLERSELIRRCTDRTADWHARWRREGFDDLAYGAMGWKNLLRQLKGTMSIWEGGTLSPPKSALDLKSRLAELENAAAVVAGEETVEIVKRWKLDLTEGYERQRRRLLPNYEFHALYNLDEEEQDIPVAGDGVETVASSGDRQTGDDALSSSKFLVGEATAELLKDLKIKRAHRTEEDFAYDETETEDNVTVSTVATSNSTFDGASDASHDETDPDRAPKEEQPPAASFPDENEDSSSYELITGLLQPPDWPEKSYNVCRCTGLEVSKALLLWCAEAIYIIDGFEQTGGDGVEAKITRVEREKSTFSISLRPKNFKAQDDERTDEELVPSPHEKGGSAPAKPRKEGIVRSKTTNDVVYEHRSTRIPFTDLYSVFRRRYQLQQNALEFYDVNKRATLIAFESTNAREEVLAKVLQSRLPNSIFSSSYGTATSYSRFMNNLKAKLVSQWVGGKMSNFEFLMQINSFAGRSFNDLTQYPVFPWVIADYESEDIDLSDPKTFRDLSKPMGALGEERAKQFRERFEALESTYFGDDDPPPFHYGTHYSSAAYVLYYLMRLEPFSRLALALQGGKFDVPDRLFHDVGRSWHSASSENLQDVRELIPEFFYLPDFLLNTNNFDFGVTQKGKTVHDVTLPKWAKGDPALFIRTNRKALESDYVSQNLHHWVDLIFGFKQRGREAIEALNTFVHVTYEGEVDLDSMEDPVQRASTIAQIQNFGQTPSRLERKPWPQRTVVHALKDGVIDFGALPSLIPLTPPFCVIGATHSSHVRFSHLDTCKLGLIGQSDKSVGDMCYVRGQLIGVGRLCSLVIPSKKYFRFGGLNNGLSVHTAAITTRFREVNKLLTIHDGLHRAPISIAKPSLNGDWLVTGCVDSTIRVWRYDGSNLQLRATLCGHDGRQIKCLDVSTEFGVIVSGCSQGRVLLWDLRTLTYVRCLKHDLIGEDTQSVSINHKNGNIITLVGGQLSAFDINGNLLAREEPCVSNQATSSISTDCPEWMDKGIVAVTGHESGEVRFWSIDYERKQFVMRSALDANPHTSTITVLRVTGVDRQDTLLVGDSSGKMSVSKTVQLDSYSPDELAAVISQTG